MLASLRSDRLSFVIMIVVVLILRMSDSNLLYRFVRGEVSDENVADDLSKLPWTKRLRYTDEWGLLIAAIIMGAHQIRIQSTRWQRDEDASRSNIQSPLLTRYGVLANEKNSDNTTPDTTARGTCDRYSSKFPSDPVDEDRVHRISTAT